jgi:hypothetical protein
MDNIESKNAKWHKAAFFTLYIISTLLIVDLAIEYKTIQLKGEIAELTKSINSISQVRVINPEYLIEHFSTSGYDTKTELEYIDILKTLLEANNIIALKDNSIQFRNDKYNLKLYDIEVLRTHLAELGIENPRIKNEKLYEEREKIQKDLLDKITMN